MLWMLTNAAQAATFCWVPGKIPYVGRTDIEWSTGAQALAAEERRASLELRDPGPVPQNGLLMVRIERETMERASDWMHTIIVLDAAGAEVVRRTPEERSDGVANTPAGVYKYWWSLIAVPLDGQKIGQDAPTTGCQPTPRLRLPARRTPSSAPSPAAPG